MVIIGLPDASVKELKDRVLSSMQLLGCVMPKQKNVNLSSSEQRKNGSSIDLTARGNKLCQHVKEKIITLKVPPSRNPYHSSLSISIIGGGTFPKPGELSLAQRGVLNLDVIWPCSLRKR